MSILHKIIPNSILDKISSKNEKSKVFILNASLSFFIKGINIFVNFLTVPLVLSFLTSTQYGIWLTLTAILNWFSLFDLGFGNGLRNRLTVAVAKDNYVDGKVYVSTTYAALSAIFGGLLIVFFIADHFINWTRVFNAPAIEQNDLNLAVLYAVALMFVQFVMRLINTVVLSFQRSALVDFTSTTVQVFILLGLFVLKLLHYNTLAAVALVYSLTPVIVFLIVSFILFAGKYKRIRPSFKFVKSGHVKSLLNLGLTFFIIQIAVLVLYASDNFIITQLFNPSDVTVYNIAYKYFSVTSILFTIVLAPFWSMTTYAFAQGDLLWIKKFIKKLMLVWLVLALASFSQLLLANPIYKFWVGKSIIVPVGLSIVMFVYTISINFCQIFSNFLNGVGKIKIQLYMAIGGMIINVPMAILFVKVFHIGISGVPLATICTVVLSIIVASVQYNKIITVTATGVWNK